LDRALVYTGALPQTIDSLNTNKFTMMALGYGMRAILGTSTYLDGLACLPTSPTPDLHVTVGVGSIYSIDPVDASAFGDLGIDNSTVYKQGILSIAQQLTITPPATSGFSQVYLVQAILQDLDAGAQVLSYFNASNPAAPYSGPANAGTSNFTIRQCNCVVALKAGTPATTGTQTVPSPDAGYTGLYAITVANGATQVASGNIATLISAPFISTKLPDVPAGVQSGKWVYAVDTGAVNAMVAIASPVPAALIPGLCVRIKVANTNTGAATFNLNGLGNVAVKRANGAAVSSGDLNVGMVVELIYDGSAWQIANYFGFTSSTTNNNTFNVNVPYGSDSSSSSNTITVAPAPAISSLAAGQTLIVKLANPVTGATTINVSGQSAATVVSQTGQPLSFGAAATGEMLWLLYDGAHWQIINPSLPLQNNLTIFVNASTGSDSFDGSQATVSGTKGPLQHIQTAVNKAFNYPPTNGFAITIQIADGTYNENVVTPNIPGPSLVINGNSGSPSNVLINGSAGSTGTISVQGPNVMQVQNLKVTSSGAGSPGFAANGSGASIFTNNTVSGAINYAVFEANQNGSVVIGNHTFAGNSAIAFGAFKSGVVNLGGSAAFTISGSISISSFAAASANGNIEVPATSVPIFINPGNVTGSKYSAALNGVINSQGAGVNYFPGTSPGTLQLGGQYA
jgi:hypothetical protein